MPKPEVTGDLQRAELIVQKAKQFKIRSLEEKAAAQKLYAKLADEAADWKKRRLAMTQKARNWVKEVNDLTMPIEKHYQSAANILKAAVTDWSTEQAAERRRLEAEARSAFAANNLEAASEKMVEASNRSTKTEVEEVVEVKREVVHVQDYGKALLAIAGQIAAGREVPPLLQRAVESVALDWHKKGFTLEGTVPETLTTMRRK